MEKEYYLIRDLDGEDTYSFIVHCEPSKFLDTVKQALKTELGVNDLYFPEIDLPKYGDPSDLLVTYDDGTERNFEALELFCYS